MSKTDTVKRYGHDEASIIIGGSQEFFKIHGHGRVDLEDAARLRRMLHSVPLGANIAAESDLLKRALVLLDLHEAWIFRIGDELEDKTVATVRPYDPFGFHRHLIHRKEAHYRGDRVPEDKSFFHRIGDFLSFAEEIILIGHSKGNSNEAELLCEFLQKHNPTIGNRIVQVEDMDLSSLSEAGIEQRLRDQS